MAKQPKKQSASGKEKTVKSEIVMLTPVKYTSVSESWSEFKLEDGTLLKIKPILVEIERHEGQFNPQGEPVYQIKAGIIMDLKSNKSGS